MNSPDDPTQELSFPRNLDTRWLLTSFFFGLLLAAAVSFVSQGTLSPVPAAPAGGQLVPEPAPHFAPIELRGQLGDAP